MYTHIHSEREKKPLSTRLSLTLLHPTHIHPLSIRLLISVTSPQKDSSRLRQAGVTEVRVLLFGAGFGLVMTGRHVIYTVTYNAYEESLTLPLPPHTHTHRSLPAWRSLPKHS